MEAIEAFWKVVEKLVATLSMLETVALVVETAVMFSKFILMPEFLVFVFERNFDDFSVFFDDENSGIEVFGFYWEGVAGVAVEGLAYLRVVEFYFMSFLVFKF